jgi:TetR/AcrR family transcriptional repressor of nem operon
MPRDGTATRQRILDSAHDLILQEGYAGTSIDQILAQSGVTKGAFFHHFASKDAMAGALFEKYLEADLRVFERTFGRAERLTSDPLQQVLLTIGFMEEIYAPLESAHAGCLLASFAYQNELMTPERRDQSVASFMVWREAFEAKLREAESLYQPVVALDLEAVADMLSVVLEGGYIMSKLLDDGQLVVRYLRVLRSYFELAFGVAKSKPALATTASA